MKVLWSVLYITGALVVMAGATVFRYTDIWFLPGLLMATGYVIGNISGQIKEKFSE